MYDVRVRFIKLRSRRILGQLEFFQYVLSLLCTLFQRLTLSHVKERIDGIQYGYDSRTHVFTFTT